MTWIILPGRRLSKKDELLAQGTVPGFGGVPEEKRAFSGVWPTDLSPAAQACSIDVDHHSCSFVGFGLLQCHGLLSSQLANELLNQARLTLRGLK